MSTQLDPTAIAGDLLYAVKTDGESDVDRDRLASIDPARLDRMLAERPQRLAFWLNVFNAYVHLLLEEREHEPPTGILERWAFFERDSVPVASQWVSLNDIRDGVLRRSRLRWGFGYLPRPLPGRFERRFRLERGDPRIHFGLSSVPGTSPPTTVYTAADVDEALDLATDWYIDENVTYDREADELTLPRLFWWYRGDFGGISGVRSFLESHDAIPAGERPSITFERTN